MPSIPDDPTAFTCALESRRETVYFLAKLIGEHCERTGTRRGTRALGPFRQAVLALRWLLDATRVRRLAADNRIGAITEAALVLLHLEHDRTLPSGYAK